MNVSTQSQSPSLCFPVSVLLLIRLVLPFGVSQSVLTFLSIRLFMRALPMVGRPMNRFVTGYVREKKTERERDRYRETETEGQKVRNRDTLEREREKERETERERERGRGRGRQKEKEAETDRDRETEKS